MEVMKLVESIEHLKQLCTGEQADFFITLNGGLRSSKTMEYYPHEDEFSIFNGIDGSFDEVKSDELDEKTNIAEAIEKKAFYKY